MPHIPQKLNEINITKLKGINNLTVTFTPHRLTAIMGINGSGKTSILHALACCYQPFTGHGTKDLKFSLFFTPNTDSRWSGSKFELKYDFNGNSMSKIYQKSQDRWTPRYSSRTNRWVSYVGIRGAVPEIEEKPTHSFIALTKVARTGAEADNIRQAASFVLNRDYTTLSKNTRRGRSFVGVRCFGIDYSAISMGSGEQRVFKILEEVISAKDYGLVLIDEIELLLHTDALKRLITKLSEIAEEKKLQIIFTTHSEILLQLTDKVNIRHIFIANDRSAHCFNDTNPKLLYALTGTQTRLLKLFVEDELSKQIVGKIAKELGIRKDVEIGIFGPAINCFTSVAGAILNGIDITNCLFILDGDLYTTEAEKKQRINSVLTGTDFSMRRKKVKALQHIVQFGLPAGQKPEQYFHTAISSLAFQPNPEMEEIRDAAIQIQAVNNSHHYIDDIISRLGFDKNDYSTVINLLAAQAWWATYTASVRTWLSARKAALNL